jgi:histone-lysine N-methyltransferase SETMAR
METEELIYHQDNAPAHRAIETLDTIDFLGMERIPHAPYSPDLAPMDFALFPRLKAELRGKRFADLDDLRMEVLSGIH